MISDKIKVIKKEKMVMKQTKNVLKLMEQYKRMGLLSKEKYNLGDFLGVLRMKNWLYQVLLRMMMS